MRLLIRFLEKIKNGTLLDVLYQRLLERAFFMMGSVTLEKMKLLLFKRCCLSKHLFTNLPLKFILQFYTKYSSHIEQRQSIEHYKQNSC